MDVQRERKPYVVIYDDGTADVELYQGKVETYHTITPVGFHMHPVPQFDPRALSPFEAPFRRSYIMEGELTVGLRLYPSRLPARRTTRSI